MWAAIVTDFNNFLKSPFGGNLDIVGVFLAVGLIMVAILLWSRVISHLSEV